jgi:hypothetical protein
MRRALRVVGLVGLGLLLGFVVRLVWPHSAPAGYARPSAGADV